MSDQSLYRSLTRRESLLNYPKASLFEHLLKLRRSSNGRKFARAFVPCNPIILSLSLAYLLETGKDYDDIVYKYTVGFDFIMENSLDGFLAALLDETQNPTLVKAEWLLGCLLDCCRRSLTAKGFRFEGGEEEPASIWDLAYASWAISNGMLYDPFSEMFSDHMELQEAVKQSLLAFGFSSNSLIHHQREKFQHIASTLLGELSAATHAGLDDASLEDLRARQEVAARIHDWCLRLYFWMPHEISAFNVSEMLFPVGMTTLHGIIVPEERRWLIPASFTEPD
jgi:hypothetical protein